MTITCNRVGGSYNHIIFLFPKKYFEILIFVGACVFIMLYNSNLWFIPNTYGMKPLIFQVIR